MAAGALKCNVVGIFLALTLTATDSYGFCFDDAGRRYGVSAEILQLIATHESNMNPDVVAWNKNGSYDYGLMGINTIWAPTLKKLKVPWESLSNPCQNVQVGAWILAQCIQRYGQTWEAIGCYHSRTPSKRDRYARQIQNLLVRSRQITEKEVEKSPTAVSPHGDEKVGGRT